MYWVSFQSRKNLEIWIRIFVIREIQQPTYTIFHYTEPIWLLWHKVEGHNRVEWMRRIFLGWRGNSPKEDCREKRNDTDRKTSISISIPVKTITSTRSRISKRDWIGKKYLSSCACHMSLSYSANEWSHTHVTHNTMKNRWNKKLMISWFSTRHVYVML